MADLDALLAKVSAKRGKITKLMPDERIVEARQKSEAEKPAITPPMASSKDLSKADLKFVEQPTVLENPKAAIDSKIAVESTVYPEEIEIVKPLPKTEERPKPKWIEPVIPAQDGFFQIPHEIYQYTQVALRTKNEIRVYNCLLRFSLGFRRDTCEASHSFIAEYIKIKDEKAIKDIIKRLISRGLIEIARPHDTKSSRPTTYRVVKVTEHLTGKIATPQGVNPPHPSGGNSSPGRGGNPPTEVGGDLPPKKENSKYTPKEILKNKTLFALVEKLVPPARREKVFENLNFWVGKFSEEEIISAYEYVSENGMLGSKTKEKPGEPLMYVATAMESLGAIIRKNKALADLKAKQESLRQQLAEQEMAMEREQARIEEQVRAANNEAMEAFLATFPEEKNRVIVLQKLRLKYNEMFTIPDHFNVPDQPIIQMWRQGQIAVD